MTGGTTSRHGATPAISVVVPAYNAEQTISRCLKALLAQDLDQPYEIIVVDDRSTDRTAQIAKGEDGEIEVLDGPGGGAGAARNVGVAHARASMLAFTDADCFPEPGWLAAGLASLAAADVAQGLVRADGSVRIGPWDRTLWVLADQGLYQTANLFMRRESFDAVGGFEDWTPRTDDRRPLGEDVDLVWRARRSGARTEFAAAAVVEHAVFPRSASAYVVERRRLRHFPALTSRVPELRTETFFARAFLNRRTALFDLALAGLIVSVLRRRRGALVTWAPYAIELAPTWRRRGIRSTAVELAADAVSCASLVEGSVRARTPLL